jgi:hypothetical protein
VRKKLSFDGITVETPSLKKYKVEEASTSEFTSDDLQIIEQAKAYVNKVLSIPQNREYLGLPPLPHDEYDEESEDDELHTRDLSPLFFMDTSKSPDSIPFFDKNEFEVELVKISKKGTFTERLKAFTDLFSEVSTPQGMQHKLWVTIRSNDNKAKEIHLEVSLFKCDYFSKAFDISCFKEAKEYYELSVQEYLGLEDSLSAAQCPLLRLRISESETELVWLQKGLKAPEEGKELSGTEVAAFAMSIQKMLGTLMYLYDDAKTQDGVRLKSFAVVDGHTWYERILGVKPATCKNWLMKKQDGAEKPKYINQDPKTYQAALGSLQKLSLKEINTTFKSYSTNLAGRFAKKVFKDSKVDLDSVTLQDLGKKVKKTPVSLALQKQFYVIFLQIYKPKSKPTKKDKEYANKLKKLDQTRVFFWEPPECPVCPGEAIA